MYWILMCSKNNYTFVKSWCADKKILEAELKYTRLLYPQYFSSIVSAQNIGEAREKFKKCKKE